MDLSNIKTFKLTDLVGKTVEINSYKVYGGNIIIAYDINDGVIYVLDYKEEKTK